MPNIIRKFVMIVVVSLAIWFSVAMVDVILGSDTGATEAAAILAFLSTLAMWLVFGLSQIGRSSDTENASTREKAKRASASGEDPRLALMLSLMTPDERDALKARLADEMAMDGEALPLADLLAERDRFTDRSQF
jgi:hypothetical protein